MSAFVVEKRHIDLLVTVALHGPRGRDVNPENAWYTLYWRDAAGSHDLRDDLSAAGRMLWAENAASVAHLYGESPDGLPGPADSAPADVDQYVYTPTIRPTTVEALKALDCFEYQACEHPGWRASSAYALCDALRRRLIATLPGYREAPWEWRQE